MDDDELTRLAEEELLREAKVGEARAAVHGVMGWLRDKTPRTNKRFLSNTISNALQHNHRQRSVGNNKKTVLEKRSKEKPRGHTVTDQSVKTTDKKKKSHHHKSSKSRSKHKSDDVHLSNKLQTIGYHSPKRKHPKHLAKSV